MKRKLAEISKLDNAYVIEAYEDEVTHTLSFGWDPESYEEKDEVEMFREALIMLNYLAGPTTSRYSEKRICVMLEEGDKYEPDEKKDESI